MDRESITEIVGLIFFRGEAAHGENASDLCLLCLLSVEM